MRDKVVASKRAHVIVDSETPALCVDEEGRLVLGTRERQLTGNLPRRRHVQPSATD